MKARVFAQAHRALTLGVIVSVSLVGFEAMAVATILPTAARELEGLGAYGWAFSSFMLANLIGSIAAGQLADREGPATPLWAGVIAITAGLLTAGFATGWTMLLLGRTLQGLGGGAIITLGYLAIRRGYPPSMHPKMMAIVSSSWVLPSLLGPLAAGALAVHLSWRWVFLLLLLPLAATLALLLPALRRMPPFPGEREGGRVLPTVFLALSLAGLLSSLELRTLWVFPGIAASLTLAIFFASKVLPPGTLRAKPGLTAGLAFRTALSFVFFGAEAFVPLGLSTLRGFSPTEAGLVLTGASLAWVCGSWTQAKLEERDGGRTRKLRVLGGFSVVVLGIATMGVVALLPGAPALLSALGWTVSGFGMGLSYPTVSVIVLGGAPEGKEGWISSSLNLMENVGIALGAGIAGAVFDLGRHLGMSDPIRLALTHAAVIAPLGLGLFIASRIFATPKEGRAPESP